jgi:hypothetical protein
MNAYTHNTLRIPSTFAGCSENENLNLRLTYTFTLAIGRNFIHVYDLILLFAFLPMLSD